MSCNTVTGTKWLRKRVRRINCIFGLSFVRMQWESLLRQNGLSVWGKERPGTLLLVNYDVNRRYEWISGDTAPEWVDVMDGLASQQGMPVLYPLLDLRRSPLSR